MCGRLRGVLRRILSLFYSKEPQFYSQVEVHNPNNVKINWHAFVPPGVMVIEKMESVSLDDRTTRYKVWNEGDHAAQLPTDDCIRLFHSRAKHPWLWIGGNSFYKSQDRTQTVEPYLVPGNRITLDLLKKIDGTINTWRYLDMTFNELDFPKEGITINAA